MNEEINISPEMGIYKVFKYLNYSIWFAVAEFVDNSIQGFLNNKDNKILNRKKCIVQINYSFTDDILTITDNSFGIDEKDHQRAFTAGIPPLNSSGLSEFGIGMKSAAIWFSPNWTVITQPFNTEIEYRYDFVLSEILSGNGNLTPTIKKNISNKGFTTIVLKDLHHKINKKNIKLLKNNLKFIYRNFLRENL